MVRDTVAALSRLADGLAAEDAGSDVGDLPDGVLAAELVSLRAVIDRVEAGFARRLQTFDRRDGARSDGCVSTVAWLRRRAGMAGNAASERVRIARQLGHLEATSDGFADGRLTYGHVAVIARAASDVGPEDAAAAEPVLLDTARRVGPDQLRLVAARLRHCVDPDGAQAAANQAHARRRLHVSETMDGLVVLDGLLDPESGAVVRTALNAATPPPNPDDGRCAAQRRADALTELCAHALDAGRLPDTGGVRPHLSVTAPAEALTGPGSPADAVSAGAEQRPESPGASRPGVEHATGIPPADVENGHPMPQDSLRRIACDAALTRVLLSSDSQPLDVGRTTRTVPPAMRRALSTRDGGCRFPGCDRPPGWTDAHHLVPWAEGGPTSLPNLLLLCRPHHRMIHDHGWQLPENAADSENAASPRLGAARRPREKSRAPPG